MKLSPAQQHVVDLLKTGVWIVVWSKWSGGSHIQESATLYAPNRDYPYRLLHVSTFRALRRRGLLQWYDMEYNPGFWTPAMGLMKRSVFAKWKLKDF